MHGATGKKTRRRKDHDIRHFGYLFADIRLLTGISSLVETQSTSSHFSFLCWGDRLLNRHAFKMGTRFQHKIVECAVALEGSNRQTPMEKKYDTYDEGAREAWIERGRLLNTLHLLGGQRNVQCRDILLKLFNFPTTNDGEHVGELLQMVRDGNYKCSSTRNLKNKARKGKP